MTEKGEASQAAALEEQRKKAHARFNEVLKKFPDALQDYKDVEPADGSMALNDRGAEEGYGEEGDEWLAFVYYAPGSDTDVDEPWQGLIHPETGDVISEDVQHFFDNI